MLSVQVIECYDASFCFLTDRFFFFLLFLSILFSIQEHPVSVPGRHLFHPSVRNPPSRKPFNASLHLLSAQTQLKHCSRHSAPHFFFISITVMNGGAGDCWDVENFYYYPSNNYRVCLSLLPLRLFCHWDGADGKRKSAASSFCLMKRKHLDLTDPEVKLDNCVVVFGLMSNRQPTETDQWPILGTVLSLGNTTAFKEKLLWTFSWWQVNRWG